MWRSRGLNKAIPCRAVRIESFPLVKLLKRLQLFLHPRHHPLMELDPAIIEQFRGTVACDGEGRPLILCHGTPFDFGAFSDTTDIGFHFGSEDQARKRERDKRQQLKRMRDASWSWKVRKAALAVHKVLVYPDDPLSWTNWDAVVGLCRRADPTFLRRLKEEGVNDAGTAALRVRDRLLEIGYDAIAYRNLYESGSGAVSDWSWIALKPESVVDLPDSIAAINDRVGHPGAVVLPRGTRDIPGAQNRSGNIRYAACRSALKVALHMEAEGRGWRQKQAEQRFQPAIYEIMVGGLPGTVELLTDIGRLRFCLDPELQAACDMTADDFVSFSGFRKEPHAQPARLIYQWLPGESAKEFVTRALSEIDHVADLYAEMAPCPMP